MKNDPLASLIELMGTMKEGENLWYQVIIRKTETKWENAGKKNSGQDNEKEMLDT